MPTRNRITLLLLGAFIFGSVTILQADQETEIFRFREPIHIDEGTEAASAVSIGSPVHVDGTIRENAVSVGGDIILGPSGVVEGDVVTIGGQVLQSPGSHIGGKITSISFSMGRVRRAIAVAIPALVVGMGVMTGAAIVLGSLGSVALAVLVLILFPGQTAAARRQIDRHPWKTLFFGFLSLLMAIPILIFLTITIIGIPLAFVVAALLMAALVLGTVALGQWLGLRFSQQLGRRLQPFAAGLLGLLLLTFLAAIPIFGILLQGFMVCIALGSVAFSRFRGASREESVLL